MVKTAKILSSPDISTLRVAVADAFDELSLELTNAEAIEALDTRVKKLEVSP